MIKITEHKIFLLNLGQAVKTARENADKTQDELAIEVNTSQGAISDYENGHVCMSAYMLSKICKALNVSPEELITLDEE